MRLAVAGVAAADQRVDEAAIVGEGVEVARAAQQQRVLDRALEMAVGDFDRAVLVGDAAIVAAGGHAVVAAQAIVAGGPVLPDLWRGCGTPPTGCRCDAPGRAAEGPERILQASRERHETLPAEHDMGMLKAAE